MVDVLVIGGSGFLGLRITRQAQLAGHRVVATFHANVPPDTDVTTMTFWVDAARCLPRPGRTPRRRLAWSRWRISRRSCRGGARGSSEQTRVSS
jgi:hypothetical protein